MRRFINWFGGCWCRPPGLRLRRGFRCFGRFNHRGPHVAYNKRTGARIEW